MPGPWEQYRPQPEEGPWSQYKPSPEPAKPQPEGALSRFGTGLYNTTIGTIGNGLSLAGDTVKGLFGDEDAATRATSILGVPQIRQAASDFKGGQYLSGLNNLRSAADLPGRMAEGVINPIVGDVKSGNYADAIGQTLGNSAMALLPVAGESQAVVKAMAPIRAAVPAVKAGINAAKSDVGTGAGVAALGIPAAAAAHATGIPYLPHVVGAASLYPAARMVARGLGKGMEAMREESARPSQQPGAYLRPEDVQPIAPRPPTPKPPAEPPPIGRPGYDPWANAPRKFVKSEFPEYPDEPTAPVQAPIEELTEAPVAAKPTDTDPGLLDGLSRSLANKPFAKLTPDQQSTVQGLAAKGTTKNSSPVEPPAPLAKPSTAKPLPGPKPNAQDIARQLADEGLKSGTFTPEMIGGKEGPQNWPAPEVFAQSARSFKAMDLAKLMSEQGVTPDILDQLDYELPAEVQSFLQASRGVKAKSISPQTVRLAAEELKKLEVQKK